MPVQLNWLCNDCTCKKSVYIWISCLHTQLTGILALKYFFFVEHFFGNSIPKKISVGLKSCKNCFGSLEFKIWNQ